MKTGIHSNPILLDGSLLTIGIVLSRFNEKTGLGLLKSCLAELRRLGVPDSNITHVSVPGALEIPIALGALAQTGNYDALIALGVVIRGDTYHFEIVANESARGISEVQLKYRLPIANAVLTTENEQQATDRMTVKGLEAAQVAVEMASLLQRL